MTVERYLRLIAGAFILGLLGTWKLGGSVLVSLHRVCCFKFIGVGTHRMGVR